MELLNITLARVAAFVEILSFDPKGTTTAPEGLSGLAKRYAFAKVPGTLAEMDFQKGVTFLSGRFNDIAIEQIQLYNNGVVVDTRSSTDNSLRVIEDMLSEAKATSGATIALTRRHFVSQIAFRSKLKLPLLNPILQPIAERLAQRTSKDLAHPISFEPTVFIIGPDTWQLKVAPSAFSIERRIDTPFLENTYFSGAPLPTTEHLHLIEEVEAALISA